MRKRIFSIILSISMIVSILPGTSFASENDKFIYDDTQSQETEEYFEETQKGVISDGNDYVIADIIPIDNNTMVEVAYHIINDCNLSMSLINDDTSDIISTQILSITAEQENIVVDFGIEQMPEYYTIYASLNDGESELCEQFTYEEKSRAWHEFISLSMDDPVLEGKTVLDFGESYSDDNENFVVVNDNVTILTVDSISDVEIEERENEAALFSLGTTEDEAYTFKVSDIDDTIDSVSSGDKVLILPKDNVYDVKTFIVDDVNFDKASLFNNEDDEITLTTDIDTETVPEDFFDFIRIDTYIEATEEDMIPNTSDDTLIWENAEEDAATLFKDFTIIDNKGKDGEKTFVKTFAEGKLKDTLKAKAGVHLNVVFSASISNWKFKIAFKVDANANINVTNEFGVKLSKNAKISGSPEVGKIPVANIGIASINIPVNIVYEFSAGASIDFSTKQEAGITVNLSFNNTKGSFIKTTKTPTSGYNLAIQGKVTAKLGARVGINVTAGAEINIPVGFIKFNKAAKIKADIGGEVGVILSGTAASVSDTNTVSHLCTFCLNGTASLYSTADVSLKYKLNSDSYKSLYSKNLGKTTKTIKTFYCSKRSDGWHFGNGSCNNKSYLVTFTVKNKSNKAISGVNVYNGSTKLGATNSKGKYSKKLKNGSYTIKFKKSGYTTKSLNVKVSSGIVSKNVTLSKQSGANETYYTIDDLTELTNEEFNEFVDNSEVVSNTIFRIQTKEDLLKLANFVNNSGKTTEGLRFVLNNANSTIDLSGEEWIPIGTETSPFKGELDGNGFTITGLTIDGNTNYAGFFGYVDTARIFDLGITNATVMGGDNVGILAGKANNLSDIYDCYATGSVSGNSYVGGLIGSLDKSSLINSYNTASIVANENAGGLVGSMKQTLTKGQISNCYNTGIITADSNIGGIAGNMTFEPNDVLQENTNTVSDTDTTGDVTLSGLQYCYFLDTSTENAVGYSMNENTIIAYPITEAQATGNSDEIIAETEGYAFNYNLLDALNDWYETFGKNVSDNNEETLDDDGIIVAESDNYNKWYKDESLNNNGYPVFLEKGPVYQLTVEYIYEDSTEAKPSVTLYLREGQNYDIDSYTIPGYYTGDIEYSGVMPASDLEYRVIYYKETEYQDSVRNLYSNYINTKSEAVNGKTYSIENADDMKALSDYVNAGGATEWVTFKQVDAIDMNGIIIEPIGNDAHPFKGAYDGQGIEISNLNLNTTFDYCGLFGYTEGAKLTGLNIATSSISGGDYTGSIVGYGVNTNIEYCYNTSATVTGNNYVGGIIGYANNVNINKSDNMGLISGNNYVGGISGTVSESTIINSYNTSEINGSSYVGGLSGTSENTAILNSYNNGNIGSENSSYVGGIVSNAVNSDIENNYNSGTISGTTNVGAIVGSQAIKPEYNYDLAQITENVQTVTDALNSWVNNECNDSYNVWLISEDNTYPILGMDYEGWLTELGVNHSTISFNFNGESHYNSILYVAQYDAYGKLLGCNTFNEGGVYSLPTIDEAVKVKFMIWDEDMQPLENSVTQQVK